MYIIAIANVMGPSGTKFIASINSITNTFWFSTTVLFAVTYDTAQLNGGIGEKFAATLNR
ncbi:hypothetical protein YDYSY3_58980 [Paenibacillus chitinolyticus]|nr:hypothetical protein YDYSY3_58980 [Paenibacillus chitinolyticus]